MPTRHEVDTGLHAVAAEIRSLDPQGSRTAQVLRDTLDQLYDGQRTRRYRWDQLHNTEKTQGGTPCRDQPPPRVQVPGRRQTQLPNRGGRNGLQILTNARRMDDSARGARPPVSLLWANDSRSQWSMGIVRTTTERLNTGGNRDRKATLNQEGRNAITWLFDHAATSSQRSLTARPGAGR